MRAPRVRALGSLSLFFTLSALLASRLGLLVHEFAGHGGAAFAMGGRIPGWRLFLFGGGWIQYERSPWYSAAEHHLIALSGVGLQSLVAAGLWLWLARSGALTPGRILGRIVALLLWAHACFYLVFGTHYGFGDGRLLHADLGMVSRTLLVLVLSLLLMTLAYCLAREGLRLAAMLGMAKGLSRIALSALALAIAGGTHLGLYAAEQRLIESDQTYAAIMQQELQRRAAEHLRTMAELREANGLRFSGAEQAAEKRAFVEKHRPFPLRPLLLGACALMACLAAYRQRARAGADSAPPVASSLRWGLGLVLLLLCAIFGIDLMA